MPYRLSHWIVELVTLTNAACGIIACLFLVKFAVFRNVYVAPPLMYLTLVWLILFFAGIFDYLDGLLARKLKVSTELGKELDSLCDAVSFGFVPAMIIAILNNFGAPLYWEVFCWASAIVYLGSALFRLARFDVITLPADKYHHSFMGMPTPLAAGMIGAVVFLYVSLQDGSIIFVKILWDVFSRSAVIQFSNHLITALPFLGLLLAWLMVSNLEFSHFSATVNFLKHRRPFECFVCFVILIPFVVLLRELVILVLPLSFALCGPVVYFYRKVMDRGR
jgi:CDP-diacylglycerol--serine O-phosphatidyltransferase